MPERSREDEEQTFGAYAHGGDGGDRHLEGQGAPALRDEEAPEQPNLRSGGGAVLPSQASMPDVPASCGDKQPPQASHVVS